MIKLNKDIRKFRHRMEFELLCAVIALLESPAFLSVERRFSGKRSSFTETWHRVEKAIYNSGE